MRSKTRRTRSMHPMERAVMAQKWETGVVDANIHALIGGDAARLVNGTGRVLFVILGAAIACDMDESSPDLRIIMGAVNAVHEQAGDPDIDEMRRASIISGLQAASRVQAQVPRKALIDAACDLEQRLQGSVGVHYSDFLELAQRRAA